MSRTASVPDPTPLSKELVRQDRSLQRTLAKADELRRARADTIKKLREAGWTWPSIAELLGVTRQRVQAIVAEEAG